MDNNFGIKISLPGYGVQSATPEQSSLDSIYDTFKLKLANINNLFGLVTILFNAEPPTPGSPTTTNLFTLKHGYNYQPFIIVMNIDSTFPGFSAMAPARPLVQLNGVGGTNESRFDTNELDYTGFICHADDTNFYIDLYTDNTKVFNLYGLFYTFKYYIFSENGF